MVTAAVCRSSAVYCTHLCRDEQEARNRDIAAKNERMNEIWQEVGDQWFDDDDFDRLRNVGRKRHNIYIVNETLFVPQPKPNFTYKMKIVLGFFQITTNLALALDIRWPETYQEFIASFGILNFDFIQWSGVDCVVQTRFYDRLLAICLTPMIILTVVLLFFLLPRILVMPSRLSQEDRVCRKHVDSVRLTAHLHLRMLCARVRRH